MPDEKLVPTEAVRAELRAAIFEALRNMVLAGYDIRPASAEEIVVVTAEAVEAAGWRPPWRAEEEPHA